MKITRSLLIFIVCSLCCNISIAPASAGGTGSTLFIRPPETSVRQLAKLELTLETTLPITNPFDPNEIDLRVRFTAPDHVDAVVPAFWYERDQAHEWRVRFTPRTLGNWRAIAEARMPNGQVHSQPIHFKVLPAAPNASGFIKTSPANQRYLAQEDHNHTPKTFLPVGLNLGWWKASKADAVKDYERWFDAMQANGANTARIWMSSWAFGLEWDDTGLGNYSQRMDRAVLLDQVLEMAEQRGIYLIVVLINHGAFSLTTNSEWEHNPYNAKLGGLCQTPRDFATNAQAKEFFKYRLRYIAARWAYSQHILAWEWWNEVDFTPIDTPALQPWLREMTPVLREHDPNQHLITLSYANDGDPAVWAMPEIDLLQRHEYNPSDPKWFKPIKDLNALQRIPAAVQKPIVFGEFGYSPNGEADTPAGREGIHLHNGLWASVFNGYASTAMYWWWDSLVEPANLWPHYTGFANFMQGEDVATMTPLPAKANTIFAVALALKKKDGALVWVRNTAYSQDAAQTRWVLSQSAGEKYVFAPRPQLNVTVILAGLNDGAYRVQWFNTLTGEIVSESVVSIAQGQLVLSLPNLMTDAAAKVMR